MLTEGKEPRRAERWKDSKEGIHDLEQSYRKWWEIKARRVKLGLPKEGDFFPLEELFLGDKEVEGPRGMAQKVSGALGSAVFEGKEESRKRPEGCGQQ